MARWLAGLGGMALLIWPLAAPPGSLFAAPQRRVDRARACLARQLSESGLVYLMTFDEPVPEDFISRRPFLFSGTVAGPGRFGQARKFDGRERTQIETPLRWDSLGPSFTLSFWANVSPGQADQCIWYRSVRGVQVGFHLENGRMTFDLPSTSGRQAVSYPFERFGEFVHLAATVDSRQGRMVLYENGRRRAESPIRWEGLPNANMAFGKHIWYANRHPFRGWLDEASAWGRALSDREISRLANARRSLAWTAGGTVRYFKWRLAQTAAQAIRATLGWADGAAALSRSGCSELRDIRRLPEVRLVFSGKVRRELVAAHFRSRKSGRRTQAGARLRSAHVAFEGSVYPALVCLSGDDLKYSESPRAGYEVILQDGARILGANRLLLLPPEGGDWLFPLVDERLRKRLGLPAVDCGLCRVGIQGLSLGTYVFLNHDRGGFLPGAFRARRTDSISLPTQWQHLFRQMREPDWRPGVRHPAWPLPSEEIGKIYDAVVREWGGCLAGDLQNPLSRKEIRWHLAQGRARGAELWPTADEHVPKAQAYADFLDEFMVLDSNASPDRLVAPLDIALPAWKEQGVEIRWRSSEGSVLCADGQVIRPDSGGPVGAQLVATIRAGNTVAEKTLTFRVMPRRISLPALFINVRDALDKSRRVDAVAEFCEPGEDAPTRLWFATQSSRGGLEHRGNTSYWRRKKLFSLKTDEPHHLLDESGRRVILAINSLQDPTFVRNRLAFDLFRSWSDPGTTNRAPDSRFAEVFLNGRYYGLFELSARVDEELLAAGPAAAGAADELRWIVYRHETLRPFKEEMRVRRPADHHGDFSGPVREFERWLAQSAGPDWEAELARRLDLGSMADLQLLLNLFQNRNGYPFKYLLHEILIYDMAKQTFFFVPWDFEMTPVLGQWEWLRSGLMTRLECDSPAYARRLADRWRELRARRGVAPEELARRVDELAKPLAGYIEWEYRSWPPGGRPWEARLEHLKALLNESIERMDEYLNPQNPG